MQHTFKSNLKCFFVVVVRSLSLFIFNLRLHMHASKYVDEYVVF